MADIWTLNTYDTVYRIYTVYRNAEQYMYISERELLSNMAAK